MRGFIRSILHIFLNVLPSPGAPEHQHGGLHIRWRIGCLRAKRVLFVNKLFRPLGRPRVEVGARLSIQGRLRLRGPGMIVFGNDVIIDSETDLYTQTPEAVIIIGDRTFLNGTRVGCAAKIVFGKDSIISDARIMDTDFHALSKRRHDRSLAIGVKEVVLGDNCWIAAGSAILKGVDVGSNSVIGFGSVVTSSIPADVIAAGNPCKVLGPVPE